MIIVLEIHEVIIVVGIHVVIIVVGIHVVIMNCSGEAYSDNEL